MRNICSSAAPTAVWRMQSTSVVDDEGTINSEQSYAIGRLIASGGMAAVHEGIATSPLGFRHRVAIKVCHPHLLSDPARRESIIDEARVSARIRHPNIVTTLDVVERSGKREQHQDVLIVMELVDGITAAELIVSTRKRGERIPIPLALRIILDIAAGLQAAHDLSVIHRDVSPANILLGRDGYAKLADFGICKGVGREADSTVHGHFKGKIGYVAPEIFRGQAPTRKVDVYGLGVVLWEMIAGKRLFDFGCDAATITHVMRGGALPSLRSERVDVSPELEAVLHAALASDPETRIATAEDFAHAIEALTAYVPASSRTLRQFVNGSMAPPFVVVGPKQTAAKTAFVEEEDRTDLTAAHQTLPPSNKQPPTKVIAFPTVAALIVLSIATSLLILVSFVSPQKARVSASAGPGPAVEFSPIPPPPAVRAVPPSMPSPKPPKPLKRHGNR